MNREQLKKVIKRLVKECLDEVLAESYIRETVKKTILEVKQPKNSVSEIFTEAKKPIKEDKIIQAAKPALTEEQKKKLAEKLGLSADMFNYESACGFTDKINENAMKTLGVFDTNFEKFL
jgi:hypothetical protein